MKPFIVTLTGPSCAGKSTLEAMLKSEGFANVISTTTRQPRVGEVDGESYYFVTRDTFRRIADKGGLVEEVAFNGNYYGVGVDEVERVSAQGKPIVVIVEPNGLAQVREYALKHGWDILSILVNNPIPVICERFLRRMTNELAASKSDEERAKIISTYASRMTVMKEEWSWRDTCEVDMTISSFNEHNCGDWVRLIKQHAQKLGW